jgi:hypothetical protein
MKIEVQKIRVDTVEFDAYRIIIRKFGSWANYQKAKDTKARVYFSMSKETVWSNLLERWNRPYKDFKVQAMPQVLEAMGLPADTKYRWSQKAGCSCGCSPGFIIDSVTGMTAYVDYTASES